MDNMTGRVCSRRNGRASSILSATFSLLLFRAS